MKTMLIPDKYLTKYSCHCGRIFEVHKNLAEHKCECGNLITIQANGSSTMKTFAEKSEYVNQLGKAWEAFKIINEPRLNAYQRNASQYDATECLRCVLDALPVMVWESLPEALQTRIIELTGSVE